MRPSSLCNRAAASPKQRWQHALYARSTNAVRYLPAAKVANFRSLDFQYLDDAAKLADASAGLTQPHPNAGCLIVTPDGRTAARTYQLAQGTASAEVLAVAEARDAAKGGTAYLNLESGDCHGDDSAVKSLIQSGISRAVVGLRHPLPHLRGKAIKALQASGIAVDVLSDVHFDAADALYAQTAAGTSSTSVDVDTADIDPEVLRREETLQRCLRVNDALIHRALLRRPLSILKYAMTLDGKIATAQVRGTTCSGRDSRPSAAWHPRWRASVLLPRAICHCSIKQRS